MQFSSPPIIWAPPPLIYIPKFVQPPIYCHPLLFRTREYTSQVDNKQVHQTSSVNLKDHLFINDDFMHG